MSKWYDVRCRHCGGDIHMHEDWSDVPDYHKECAWYEKSCEHCGRGIRAHRVRYGWYASTTLRPIIKLTHLRLCGESRE